MTTQFDLLVVFLPEDDVVILTRLLLSYPLFFHITNITLGFGNYLTQLYGGRQNFPFEQWLDTSSYQRFPCSNSSFNDLNEVCLKGGYL